MSPFDDKYITLPIMYCELDTLINNGTLLVGVIQIVLWLVTAIYSRHSAV